MESTTIVPEEKQPDPASQEDTDEWFDPEVYFADSEDYWTDPEVAEDEVDEKCANPRPKRVPARTLSTSRQKRRGPKGKRRRMDWRKRADIRLKNPPLPSSF